MRCAVHVTRIGEVKNNAAFLVGNSEGKSNLGDMVVDGKNEVTWLVQKQ
jgi:hypothetical protein